MSVDKQITENGIARYKEDRLLRRALKEDWHLTAEQKKKILERQVEIATDPNQGARDASRAAAILVNCRKNDTEKLLKVLDKVSPDQHEIEHGGTIGIHAVLEELKGNEEFQEFARARARGSHAGSVGGNSQQQPMVASQALNGYRPGSNGHTGGTNGHSHPAH